MAVQRLFEGVPPAAAAGVPGMVTPNMTADIQQPVNIQDQIAAYNFAKQKKADRAAEWARAAAQNRMRQAVSKLYGGGGGGMQESTMAQSNPQHYYSTAGGGKMPGYPGFQGSVKYAPPGLRAGALGLWAEDVQKRAMRENRSPPLMIQRYADLPQPTGGSGYLSTSQSPPGRVEPPRMRLPYYPSLFPTKKGPGTSVYYQKPGGGARGGGGDYG